MKHLSADYACADSAAEKMCNPQRYPALPLLPSRFFHFGARPALPKRNAQLRAGSQIAGVGYHAPAGILHLALAARQHSPGIEQGEVLRDVFHLCCALRM